MGLCWATEASPIPALEPAMGSSRTQQTTEGRVNSKQWHWRLILKDVPLFLILPHYLLALTLLKTKKLNSIYSDKTLLIKQK